MTAPLSFTVDHDDPALPHLEQGSRIAYEINGVVLTDTIARIEPDAAGSVRIVLDHNPSADVARAQRALDQPVGTIETGLIKSKTSYTSLWQRITARFRRG